MAETLRDRLKSLGVKSGMKPFPADRHPSKYPIQDVVHGDWIQNSLGSTYIHQEQFPPDYMHGVIRVGSSVEISTLARWAKTADLENLKSERLVFLDTETTGLSGGTGTFVFLVGIGFLTSSGFQVTQFFLNDPSEEPAFLVGLAEAVSGFQGVVTFNGKSFDIPILRTRYTLNGLSTPFQNLSHIDLLPLARRIWKYRLENRNLGILETEILGLKRSGQEIPGWVIPEMYIDFCRTGDARPLKGVFYHNAMDIVSLAALMIDVTFLIDHGSSPADTPGVDYMAVGRLYEKLGEDAEAESFFMDAFEKPMEKEHLILTRKSIARLHKKNGNWIEALPIFELLAVDGEWDAADELAKYYEHTEKDLAEAHRFACLGLENCDRSDLPEFKKNKIRKNFHRRINRLEGLAGKNASG